MRVWKIIYSEKVCRFIGITLEKQSEDLLSVLIPNWDFMHVHVLLFPVLVEGGLVHVLHLFKREA